MLATKRGRNLAYVYTCRNRRERQACTNATGTPMGELNTAVVAALFKTFTVESFTAHLERQAHDSGARQQREAERAGLIVDLPKLAAIEARLVKRIGQVEDDALVAGLKAEWSEAKVNRERAERRLGELEGIERDLAADRTEVEQLRTTWASWSAVLQAAIDAPTGSIPAETQHQARQILRKALVSTIKVWPAGAVADLPDLSDENKAFLADEGYGAQAWVFEGYGRAEGVISGGLVQGLSVNVRGFAVPPISGGSDAELNPGRDTEMAPHTPHRWARDQPEGRD